MTGRILISKVLRSVVAGLTLGGLTITIAGQTYQPTQEPVVTAQNEPWYIAGAPITYAGSLYYPSGPQVYFNRNEMARSGTYRGIPLYVRTMIEPFSKVYVPLAGGLMQPYERRREGALAGTVGSSAPSFPGEVASELYREVGSTVEPGPPDDRVFVIPVDTQPPEPEPIGTGGVSETPIFVPPAGPLTTARQPEGLNGIFIEFDGRRWFSSGRSIEFVGDRFSRIGEYRGFPVYTDRQNPNGLIYVAVTHDTPLRLAPYARRQ